MVKLQLLSPAPVEDVARVAENLRVSDRREALSLGITGAWGTRQSAATSSLVVSVRADGIPVGLAGVRPREGGVGQVWAVATRETDRHPLWFGRVRPQAVLHHLAQGFTRLKSLVPAEEDKTICCLSRLCFTVDYGAEYRSEAGGRFFHFWWDAPCASLH